MDSRSSAFAIRIPFEVEIDPSNGRKIALDTADMLPVSTPAGTRIVPGKKRRFLRRRIECPFSPEIFHLKLLSGTAVGVLVTIVLAVTCAVFTFRHRQRDALHAYTIEVKRLSSLVENDIAALENSHRSRLLTGEGTYPKNSARLRDLFHQYSTDLNDVPALARGNESVS